MQKFEFMSNDWLSMLVSTFEAWLSDQTNPEKISLSFSEHYLNPPSTRETSDNGWTLRIKDGVIAFENAPSDSADVYVAIEYDDARLSARLEKSEAYYEFIKWSIRHKRLIMKVNEPGAHKRLPDTHDQIVSQTL